MKLLSHVPARTVIAVLAALHGATTARADLPPGFVRTQLSADVGFPTSLAVLPDSRLIVGDYFGYITLVQEGQPTIPLLQLDGVVAGDDHGLLGLTIDPDFSTNGYFYVFYTSTGPYDLIARYTLTGTAVDPASRTITWQNPDLCPGESHHGGSINFGPDGNLYITTGEQFEHPENAQTLVNQHGKILRLAPDGSVPPDNPYVNTPGAQGAIWAMGMRNPFRANMDMQTGTLWIGDVGGSLYEEIDRAVIPTTSAPGPNFGWPLMEGPQCSISSCAQYTAPVFAWSHQDPTYTATGEGAIVCGPIYRGSAFPPEYHGNLFYGDWVNGWIRRLVFDASGNVTADLPFDTGRSDFSLTDLRLGPDGALYYTILQGSDFGEAGVYKISATQGGNIAPVVVAGATPTQGNTAPLSVQFNSTGTHDPDNAPGPLSYAWDFGDGQTSTQPSPTHPYQSRGQYRAVLTVSDGSDAASSTPITITVGHAPVPTITQPNPPTTYDAGQTINFAGTATDSEDGTLAPAAFSWVVNLIHLNHTHRDLGPLNGTTQGSFTVPVDGHDPENTHYRIVLTVTDSDGIPSTTSMDLIPHACPINVDTVPSGIPVFLDGRALATPRQYTSLVGFHHTIAAQDSYILNGVAYFFSHWSVPEAGTFSFISPAGGMSLVATYTSCGSADFNCDGDVGTDADIEAFFACLAGDCPALPCAGNADFNGDGDTGTDADIEAFFRVLAGGTC